MISPEEVERIARLAALEVASEELPELAAQLDRIVEYVGHLPPLDAAADRAAAPATLRADEVAPAPLAEPPAGFAPDFREGFFVVPRLSAMDQG
ncbi:MAG: Asp-tRNA(Asn)/Glu-tRNA(Gln) amidotransferase subunit GatC [Gemmatimonadales bacterium]